MSQESGEPRPAPSSWVLVAITWVLVGVPLLWGISITFRKAALLFR